MMNKRVTIAKRTASEMGDYGVDSGGIKYQLLGTFWAAEDFNRGVKALREGAVDAYDVVIFRFDWHEGLDRWCLLQYEGRWYQILSLNGSFQANEMQITAQEMSNQDVTMIENSNN